MKKLALDLDAIRVETFETDGRVDARGTIHGRQDLAYAVVGDSPLASCVASCDDSVCATCDTCREPCPSQVCETQIELAIRPIGVA